MSKSETLRSGWTTGAVASAAAKAAFYLLNHQTVPNPVKIRLPRGEMPSFIIEKAERQILSAAVSIIKDAGDDPDVTHGALITVRLEPNPNGGICFKAGEGVGVVTLAGLPLDIGEPAINPAPRRQIQTNLEDAALELHLNGRLDLIVTISVKDGEALARKTMNARLGIIGGLSILGTTGIVQPYSCAAWIYTIIDGLKVAHALKLPHLLAATGNNSERVLRAYYPTTEQAVIDMGDFIGALLKGIRAYPPKRLSLAGGVGKLSKLAAGRMDLHSKAGLFDPHFVQSLLQDLSLDPKLQQQMMALPSMGAIMAALGDQKYAMARLIGLRALEVVRASLQPLDILLDMLVVDRAGMVLAQVSLPDNS